MYVTMNVRSLHATGIGLGEYYQTSNFWNLLTGGLGTISLTNVHVHPISSLVALALYTFAPYGGLSQQYCSTPNSVRQYLTALAVVPAGGRCSFKTLGLTSSAAPFMTPCS